MRIRVSGWAWLCAVAMGVPVTAHAADGRETSVDPNEASAGNEQRPPSPASTTLATLLDADGFLALPKGFSGSIDPQGFELMSKAGERPRFVPKNAIDDVERWDDQFGYLGCDADVMSMAVAADGSVYLGGYFTSCGNVSVNHVVRWNPQLGVFSPLGTGATNGVNSAVFAIAISGNDVYLGGQFNQAGGQAAENVARFNVPSGQWFTLGSGAANGTNNPVYALALSGSDLYVGGTFFQAGGLSANYVARFDTSSSQWFPLGSGATNGLSSFVNALAVSASGSDVYVGGVFNQAGGQTANRVARFNISGGQWFALGSGAANGVNSEIRALVVLDGNVFVGGSFDQAGGQPANYVARFSVSGALWSALGSGAANGVNGPVESLAASGIDLYAGGNFTQAGGQSANGVARFRTLIPQWFPLGAGATNGANSYVSAIAISGSDVYVGGGFNQAGGQAAARIARNNSSSGLWFPLGSGAANGIGGTVRAIVVSGNDVYVGGEFNEAGGKNVNKVARFNSASAQWFSLGNGSSNGVSGPVFALAMSASGGELYVGGIFTQAGGLTANNVARFNTSTSQWLSLGSGAANGVSDFVFALATSGSDVYVGGDFVLAGGQAANRVARFNTSSGQWFSLGSGAANGVNATVGALVVSGGTLFAGGPFSQAGGQNANGVARFDGSQWLPLGSGASNGVGGVVSAIALSGSDVFVGGSFSTAGGQAANNVARFNLSGSQWFSLGSGTANGVSGNVLGLAASGSDLYVGGFISQAGGQAASRVARFNLTSGLWFPLRSGAANGTSATVNALSPSGSDMVLGGAFTQAGGVISLRIARFDARNGVSTSASTSPAMSTVVNTPVSLNASVDTQGFPGLPGTVDFFDGGNAIPGCTSRPMIGGLETRTASCSIAGLAVGPHSIVARYSGDSLNFIGTSDAVGLAITAPAITVNPPTLPGGVVGTGYDQTVSVSGTGAIAPFGYFITDGTPPPGLALIQSNGRLLGSPSLAGSYTFEITAFDNSPAAVGGPFEATREYTIVVGAANQAPTVTYNPGAGTQVTLPSGSGVLNEAVSTLIGLNSNGALGTGNTSVGCGISAGFTVSPPTITASTSGLNPAASFTVGCNLGQGSVNGTLSCTETSTPPGSQITREWPLVCPGAAAVAPTLTFSPDAGNSIVFPDGALNGTASRTIQVTSSGIVGTGSSNLSCTISQGTGFAVTSGGSQTISSSDASDPVGLSCTRTAIGRTGELTCNETKSPGGVQSPRTWSLQCPAGVIVSNSIVSVGTRSGVRNQRVTVPIAFRGDGTTVDFEADVSFDTSKLLFQSVQAVPGATCVRLPSPQDDRIRVSAPNVPSANPLSPNLETRYCDVTFKIASAAAGGFSAMPVATSRCSDGGGANPPCTTSPAPGGVGIAAVESSPSEPANLSLCGVGNAAEATRMVRITNRGDTPLDFVCQVTGPSALGLRTPAGFTINAQQSSDVEVGCLLPPLGTTLNGQLICDTMDDPVRPRVQIGLSCVHLEAGGACPLDQILGNEAREGDQLGTSAAVAMQAVGEVMAIGAPFAGSDGNGRVIILEDSGGGAGGGSGAGKRSSGDDSGSAGRWRVLTQLAAPPNVKAADGGTEAQGKFGQAVALSRDGSRAAVGAPFGGLGNQGLVWLFNRPPTGWGDVDFTNPSAAITPPNVPGVLPSEFGDSLAFTPDGDLVVGAPGTSIGTPGVGAAYLFDFTGGIFVPPSSPLTSTQPAGNGRFGDAIAASDKLIVVGAPQEGPQGTKPGTIYGFPLFNGIPDPPTAYRPPDTQPNDNFGAGVAISGDTVVVGSPGADTSSGVDSGAITVYKPQPDGTLITPTKLIPPPGTAQGAGASVATNGDVIVAGAPTAAPVNPNTKTGRVLMWDTRPSYPPNQQPIQVIENVGGADQDQFGRAVAVGLRTLVAGVPLDDYEFPNVPVVLDVGRADPFELDRILRAGFE